MKWLQSLFITIYDSHGICGNHGIHHGDDTHSNRGIHRGDDIRGNDYNDVAVACRSNSKLRHSC